MDGLKQYFENPPPDMSEIDGWMNYRCKALQDHERWVVIVEDHRAVLPVIAQALNKKLFSSPPTLVRFDRHGDYEKEPNACLFHAGACVEHLRRITDTHIGQKDNSWLTVAVHAGYVSSVGTWFIDESEGEDMKLGEAIAQDDYEGLSHFLWFTQGLTSWVNLVKMGDVTAKLMADGCSLVESKGSVSLKPGAELWLDIDLDFAAKTNNLQAYSSSSTPWSQETFDTEFKPGGAATTFVGELIKNAKLITICTEPTYTGGLLCSAEILGMLHKAFPADNVFCW